MQPTRGNCRNKAFETFEWVILSCVFLICLIGAYLLPFEQCPDEGERLKLTRWIIDHAALPTGNEPELIIENWGFSYATRPYLSSIIGAVFAKCAGLITESQRAALLGARMCSVLSVTGCCAFCLLLGKRLFEKRSSARLFAVLVCFLPQVLFLGMYQNNDALSLFGVSMLLYTLVGGRDNHWSVGWCAAVGVSMAICLLSYYTVYGWLLLAVVFCIATCRSDPRIDHKGSFILKRGLLIFAVALCLAGWQFIRTAYHHNMDFLGMSAELTAKSNTEAQNLGFQCAYDMGYSFTYMCAYDKFMWFRKSIKSFIGVFGNMRYYAPPVVYYAYFAIFIGGTIAYLINAVRTRAEKDRWPLLLLLFASSASCIAVSLLQSYFRDFQAQGRYIITCILPLAYMLARALDCVKTRDHSLLRRFQPQYMLAAVWILLCACMAAYTMARIL